MPSIAEIINIINDGPLLFRIAVIVGIIFIIIAAIPSLSIFVLKSEKLTLTKNQSVMLAVFGCLLLIVGLAGIVFLFFGETNIAPVIKEINITPPNAEKFGMGSTVFVSITAIDPDRNFFQNITREPLLQYKLIIINQTKENISLGPSPNSLITFQVGPELEGSNFIKVSVTDRPEGEKDIKETIYDKGIYRIAIAHIKPEIKIVSPKNGSSHPVNKRITIEAKAIDSYNQILYYKFLRMSPTSDTFSEIPPSNRDNFLDEINYWTPKESDIGENRIRVEANVGDENGRWRDIGPAHEELIINVTDK